VERDRFSTDVNPRDEIRRARADVGQSATMLPSSDVTSVELLERMTDAFIALDRDWRITYMNGAAVRLNGKPREDSLWRSHWDEWPLTVGSEVERQYKLAMRTQQPVHFEHHYMAPGRDFWHRIHAYPSENGLSIFFRDVTEEKRAGDLAALLAKAGSEFAATPDEEATLRIMAQMALPLLGEWSCVYVTDDAGQVTRVELAATDPRTLTLLRAVVPDLAAAADDRMPFVRAMRLSRTILVSDIDDSFYAPMSAIAHLRDRLRELAPTSLLSVPLIARGRTIGAITFGTADTNRRHNEHDVHAAREVAVPAALALDNARLYDAERRARLEAEVARQRAEEANRAKADFLSTMSHELRTPLNAIAGYVELLQMGLRGPLAPLQLQDLERIARNQTHVTRLINDVASFARLEAGRVEFDLKPVSVAKLLMELEGFIEPQTAERDHVLRVRICEPRVIAWADADKTMQILLNLTSNALKHTPPGTSIEVFCDDAVAADVVRINVRDTGRGVPRDKQQIIFEPFVQIGRARSHPVEGIGLGLAISRDLARGMGGTLTVESQLGEGATFTLSLPTRAISA
jgi:PAS domain S-box-containing protein